MKTKEIAKRYELPKEEFERFILDYPIYDEYKSLTGGYDIPDNLIEELVESYKTHLEDLKQEEAEEILMSQEKQQALSRMLITSGFTFDGYKITKYSGYISGDDVVQIPRELKFFAGTSNSKSVGEELTKALVNIRRQALIELKSAAYDLGCNAVIGVDFDYITMEPETSNIQGKTVYLPYVVCVTANGNAVVIEKID